MSLFSRSFRRNLTRDLTISRPTFIHCFVRQWVKGAGVCLLLSFIMLFAMCSAAVVDINPRKHVPSTETADHPDAPRLANLSNICMNITSLNDEEVI